MLSGAIVPTIRGHVRLPRRRKHASAAPLVCCVLGDNDPRCFYRSGTNGAILLEFFPLPPGGLESPSDQCDA